MPGAGATFNGTDRYAQVVQSLRARFPRGQNTHQARMATRVHLAVQRLHRCEACKGKCVLCWALMRSHKQRGESSGFVCSGSTAVTYVVSQATVLAFVVICAAQHTLALLFRDSVGQSFLVRYYSDRSDNGVRARAASSEGND